MTIGMSMLLLVGGFVVTRGGDDLLAPTATRAGRAPESSPAMARAPIVDAATRAPAPARETTLAGPAWPVALFRSP